MSQSNKTLEPRLIVVDTYTLCHIDDMIQDLSNDAEKLAYALNAIQVDDPASKGVIHAIQATLFSNSELASDLSEQMSALILLPTVGETSNE